MGPEEEGEEAAWRCVAGRRRVGVVLVGGLIIFLVLIPCVPYSAHSVRPVAIARQSVLSPRRAHHLLALQFPSGSGDDSLTIEMDVVGLGHIPVPLPWAIRASSLFCIGFGLVWAGILVSWYPTCPTLLCTNPCNPPPPDFLPQSGGGLAHASSMGGSMGSMAPMAGIGPPPGVSSEGGGGGGGGLKSSGGGGPPGGIGGGGGGGFGLGLGLGGYGLGGGGGGSAGGDGGDGHLTLGPMMSKDSDRDLDDWVREREQLLERERERDRERERERDRERERLREVREGREREARTRSLGALAAYYSIESARNVLVALFMASIGLIMSPR